ncbi:hypothetical protein S245_037766, partial [Arachis hypogaea]
LLNGFESTSVRISHQSTQTSWGGTDEVNNGTSVVKTIEEVLKQCPKKVKTPIGNRYEYAKCGHTHGCAALRYKVEVMVFDGTGSITLLLWDRETNQLVLKRMNILKHYDQIYTVMKVCDDKETVVKNKPKQMNISTFVNITVHRSTLHLSSLPSPSSWRFLSTPASSIPPFRSAAELLLTLSPVGASKLTRSLTQLTSQTLSSGSTVTGLASCLCRVALFLRRKLCSSIASSVPASVASSVHASVASSVLL